MTELDSPPAAAPADAPAAKAPAPGRRSLRRAALQVALLLLGVLLLALAVRQVDPAAVQANLARLDAGSLALASLAYAAAWLLRTVRLFFLARAVGIPMRPADAATTGLGANALNIVAPARLGDVAAFVHLRELAGKGPEAAAAILGWRLSDLGGLLLLALLAGLPILLFLPHEGAAADLRWAMVAGAAFLVLAWAGVHAVRHHRLRALLERLAHRLLGARAPTGVAFGRAVSRLWMPAPLAAALGLAVAAWVADTLLAGILLHALSGDLSSYALAVVPLVLANVAKALPTTPGAIGVYELVFWVSLQQFGVASATALAAAVATHLLVNLLTLALGAPGAFAMGRSAYRRAGQKERA